MKSAVLFDRLAIRRRIRGVVMAALICAVATSNSANARVCRTRTTVSTAVAQQGFIVVPFAVPVAVPSYVQYQASNYAAPTAPPSISRNVDQQQSKLESQRPSIGPLVQTQCLQCHAGERAKAGLRLDVIELGPEKRLRAIGRLLADDPKQRMPKGQTLTAQELGQLIQELSKPPNMKGEEK